MESPSLQEEPVPSLGESISLPGDTEHIFSLFSKRVLGDVSRHSSRFRDDGSTLRRWPCFDASLFLLELTPHRSFEIQETNEICFVHRNATLPFGIKQSDVASTARLVLGYLDDTPGYHLDTGAHIPPLFFPDASTDSARAQKTLSRPTSPSTPLPPRSDSRSQPTFLLAPLTSSRSWDPLATSLPYSPSPELLQVPPPPQRALRRRPPRQPLLRPLRNRPLLPRWPPLRRPP